MRLLGFFFIRIEIAIEIGIDQVFRRFLFYLITGLSESTQHGHHTVHSRKRQSVSLQGGSTGDFDLDIDPDWDLSLPTGSS